MKTLYIDNPEQLQDFCQQLEGSEWLALDTEFMRESTYYPKLCLLQVGTPNITACIDPLALPDLNPLLDLIYNPSITKVMHAAGQDMEILYHLRGSLPTPVFDTQIAAPLLGHPEQAGYARLAEEILGVQLAKSHTRADWSHRPLSKAQLSYAAEDVIYLCDIYLHLRDELKRRQRLQWLEDDFAELSNPARYNNPPELAWRRVKAAHKLKGAALAVLQSLAQWREQQAKSENRPRGWLLKDDVLADIAKQQPKSLDELKRIRGLHERTIKRYGKEMLGLIHEAKGHTPEPNPEYVRKPKPTQKQEALVCLLNALVHMRAEEQSLNPAQLAPHKELQRLVLGHEDVAVLHGWRRKLIGEELQTVLRGECVLSIDNGSMIVQPHAS